MAEVVSSLDEIESAVCSGQVVGIPTDTVYGLAADASRLGADEMLARVKRRSSGIPLQVLVSGIDQALEIGVWSERAARSARMLWPGAITFVVARDPRASLHLGGDPSTVGIRWPDHEPTTEICRRCGPLAATSANLHGEPPLETARSVADAFGLDVAVVLDGGRCPGTASSVVDMTGDEPRILREGAVGADRISEAFGAS